MRGVPAASALVINADVIVVTSVFMNNTTNVVTIMGPLYRHCTGLLWSTI